MGLEKRGEYIPVGAVVSSLSRFSMQSNHFDINDLITQATGC